MSNTHTHIALVTKDKLLSPEFMFIHILTIALSLCTEILCLLDCAIKSKACSGKTVIPLITKKHNYQKPSCGFQLCKASGCELENILLSF